MIRKKQLLIILGVLLLAAIYYAYTATPTLQKAPRTGSRPGADISEDSGGFGQSAEQKLLLERLQRGAEASSDVKRDIFQFYVKPVVVRPPPPKPVVRPVPVAPAQPVVRPVAQPAPRVVARINYLGLLETEDHQVFFLEVDDEVVVARSGESFGKPNQYRIKSFDGEKLIVSQGQGHADIVLKVGDPVARTGSAVPAQTPSGASPIQFQETPKRPKDALRLQSFKIRDPSVMGQ